MNKKDKSEQENESAYLEEGFDSLEGICRLEEGEILTMTGVDISADIHHSGCQHIKDQPGDMSGYLDLLYS